MGGFARGDTGLGGPKLMEKEEAALAATSIPIRSARSDLTERNLRR
jgi:hypothetical protein